MTISQRVEPINLRPDWIVLSLPTALAIRVFDTNASLVVIALLVAGAYVRKPEGNYRIQPGPLLLLLASCAIVISRPDGYFLPAVTILFGLLTYRLSTTVIAQKLVTSMVDGCGIYLLANVVGEAAGLRSPSLQERISNLQETTGFVRTVFPLAWGINTPAIIAGAYLVGTVCLFRGSSGFRRIFSLAASAAAVVVIAGAGSRNALAVSIVLSVAAVFLPFISRWLAQAATLLAATSAFILPTVIGSIVFVVKPLTSLASGRDTTDVGIDSIQGREQIWDGSITFWNDQVRNIPDILLGFGENGQFHSGASYTYIYIVRGLGSHPELANVHNSFLQQLFDGGIIGWIFLVAATYWTSVRLAKSRRHGRDWALTAIFVMTVILFCNTTEATLAPGIAAESFWLLLLLTGVSCQAEAAPLRSGDRNDARSDHSSYDH